MLEKNRFLRKHNQVIDFDTMGISDGHIQSEDRHRHMMASNKKAAKKDERNHVLVKEMTYSRSNFKTIGSAAQNSQNQCKNVFSTPMLQSNYREGIMSQNQIFPSEKLSH